jgi:small-conductance mechanosensitive channel
MRIPLLCSLILSLALPAFAEVPAVAPGQKAPALLAAPPQESSPAAKKPAWLPLPETAPAETSPAIAPLVKPAPADTSAPPQPAATQSKSAVEPAAEPEAPAKKAVKTPQRRKSGTGARAFGRGNNIPPLIAAAVEEPETAKQPLSPWPGLFTRQQSLRQVAATPPLLAGIRPAAAPAEEPEPQVKIESVLAKKLAQQEDMTQQATETLEMLAALVELQKNIKQQIGVIGKKLKTSTSEAEKQALQEELTNLDKQLSETGGDFERLATGVETDVFSEQKQVTFSWKDELSTLLEPSIKELKQLTARARLKSQLKETITGYDKQLGTARQAVSHLNKLMDETKNPKIKNHLGELLPAWQNVEKRISSKLELTQRELTKLEENNVSLIESSGDSVREFFRNRGWFLLVAFLAFVVILLACRLFARLVFFILPGAKKEQRPIHVRILDIFFQIFSVVSAIFGLIFVLYTAEDWFLLSAAIILFLGLAWTVRQTLPKMWQQVRLVLNMGSIREGERVIYNGVPWKVEALNVFCKLYNPALAMHLRIPIENMIGLISRPYHIDEPWFPCKKGDWVAIDGKPFAKVVSLSHEQVEVVELGGRRIIYQTGDFLGLSPANLSRNFSLRVVFGLSYSLQAQITTTVPETLKTYIQKKLEDNGYADDCLSLAVDFFQAGASSLDLAVLADFKGEQAPAYRRLERALAKWCVECCNVNSWEIPFPQMTVHLPSGPNS